MKVTFNFDAANGLADLADRVARGSGLRTAAVATVNAVLARHEKAAVSGATQGINLTQAYVRERNEVTPASGSSGGPVRAELLTRGRLTVMGHYPLTHVTAPARGRARGDPSRGVPPGRKAAGVSVAIKAAAPAFSAAWFTMRLRRGTEAGDTLGVFYRGKRTGKAEHRYAVAPYSLMRYQNTLREDDVYRDLSETGGSALAEALRKGFGQ